MNRPACGFGRKDTMQDKDTRPFFVLTNEYTRHRKVRGLSDKAFRLHVTLVALCNEDRNNGIISKQDLEIMGAKAGKELITNQLVHPMDDGVRYQLHDYLKHQHSRKQIEELIDKKKEAGKRGGKVSAHNKWHVERGLFSPDCELCPAETG